MFQGKPIIGLAGGIGSGKSFVARMFGELGCLVCDSDTTAKQVFLMPEVAASLKVWWGDSVLDDAGRISRKRVAARVFSDPVARERLESLIHPRVNEIRIRQMTERSNDPNIVAYVWDTPLLFETGLNQACDAVVFVEAPLSLRLARVQETRAWNEAELGRREKSQLPLDKKRSLSEYIVENTADADVLRGQVREVLSRILDASVLSKSSQPPASGRV